MKEKYSIIGLMSGTSLDGLDIAFCIFERSASGWKYQIENAITVAYPMEWKQRLMHADSIDALGLALLDTEYGHLCGSLVSRFIREWNIRPDFIASHGHTVFHQPDRKLTLQVGKGAAIFAETGIPVIHDFRSLDVALGGQGAPLVPAGDRQLFREYTYCLNLGGFANISFDKGDRRIAFDICPVNIVLNKLAGERDLPHDTGGALARSGRICPPLLERFEGLAFYAQSPPKSLGKEWVMHNVEPILREFQVPVEDKLATFCEHIANQVAGSCGDNPRGTLLVTGGGVFNTFLMERIEEKAVPKVIVPDSLTVNYKEALVFAFLGLLRLRNEPNCLSSVTGATRDNCGGSLTG